MLREAKEVLAAFMFDATSYPVPGRETTA